MTADARLLFATRILRMFGYGLLSVVLVLYLIALGISGAMVGAILTLTLVGDAAISLWLTTHADRFGRRRVLILSSLLVLIAGVVFALTDWLILPIARRLPPMGTLDLSPFVAYLVLLLLRAFVAGPIS